MIHHPRSLLNEVYLGYNSAVGKYPAIDEGGKITIATRLSAAIFVLGIPTLGTALAAYLACVGEVTVADLSLFVGMYLVSGVGITVGYHRLLTHRSFETPRFVRYLLAFMGATAAEGAPIIWVSQHRQHHSVPDEPGDPHSPHVGRRPGFFGALRALWHAHYGHVFGQVAVIDPERYAPDLEKEAVFRWMEKWASVPVALSFALPAAIGYAAGGTWWSAFTGFLWGGLVRLFVITHATGAVNSLCHFFGRRPFDVPDRSTNVWWLMPATLGESWHNGHHAFPTSARHGLLWWEIDPAWVFIWTLEKLGLAWNVVRIGRTRILEKRRR